MSMSVEQVVTLPCGKNENLSVKQKVDGEHVPNAPSANVEQNASFAQTDAGKAWELEKQLHEQYAINNNAHTSSFISFLVSLLALFVGLGYLFVETPPYGTKYTLDVFLIFTPFVSGILFFLTALCSQIGYAQRSNQIVIEQFRRRYGLYIYNPTEGKSFISFLPDYYNIFWWLFWGAQIVVLLLTVIRICNCVCQCGCETHEMCICTAIISILLQVVSIVFPFFVRNIFYKKYYDFSKRHGENASKN